MMTQKEIDEERFTLELAVRALWTPIDWNMVEDYERESEGVSMRCSWRTKAHPAGDLIETGEELCGSWHQQSNGGKRFWFAVSGEIEDAR